MSAAAKIESRKVRKQYGVTTKAEGLPDGQISFVASKETQDRDSDVISVRGIDTAAFEPNPVFLWAHDQKTMPIGKIIEFKIVGDEFHILVEFDLDDEFAAKAYSKYKRGFLNAVSIGFLADASGVRKLEGGGFYFERSELLEVSAVPVPSNREAIALVRAAGEGPDEDVVAWAKQILKGEKMAEKNTKQVVGQEKDASATEVLEEIAALIEGKAARLESIRAIYGDGNLNASAKVELYGLLVADSRANAIIIDVAVSGYTYYLAAPEGIMKGFEDAEAFMMKKVTESMGLPPELLGTFQESNRELVRKSLAVSAPAEEESPAPAEEAPASEPEPQQEEAVEASADESEVDEVVWELGA